LKLRILCDLDEITAQLLKKWLAKYNADHNDTLDINTVVWDGLKKQSKIGDKIYEYLHQPGFFADLEPVDGAIEALKEFKDDGHHVVILSAPSYPGSSAVDKLDWIHKHLPFIHKRDVMLGWHKFMMKGDVLIDDSPVNIKEYRKAWPDAHILTIAYNHNKEVAHLTNLYAHDANNTAAAWKAIRGYVKGIAAMPSRYTGPAKEIRDLMLKYGVTFEELKAELQKQGRLKDA
jgi:5'-nucleotidase